MSELKMASVLAFERKLDPSDGLMYQGDWNARGDTGAFKPIMVRESSIRGTISNRMKTQDQDPVQIDKELQKPNVQTVDLATLDDDRDTLMVKFTLRVLDGVGQPSACNNQAVDAKIREIVKGYADREKFSKLAGRYAQNLANGRFLWRNRKGVQNVEVRVAEVKDGEVGNAWVFDALEEPVKKDFGVKDPEGNLKALGDVIATGLRGENQGKGVLLEVKAFARIGFGQTVFPSQEINEKVADLAKASTVHSKGKYLYQVEGQAGIHSQKLGNAIRTIDTWYPEFNNPQVGVGPIAAEPYGAVTTLGQAFRVSKQKADFYTLFDQWIEKGQAPALEQQHYVMAVLVRGGVFGKKGS